MLAQTLFAGV